MLAYHNDQNIKDLILAKLAGHCAADQLVKGHYWEGGKGCAVGCAVESSDHGLYETTFGIPRILARLEDTIFEGTAAAAAAAAADAAYAAAYAAADAAAYAAAYGYSTHMRTGNTAAAIVIEKKYGLFGLSPQQVSEQLHEMTLPVEGQAS